MITTQSILDGLVRAFGQGAELEVAGALFNFISKYPETNHINLQLVRQIIPNASSDSSDSVIFRTLQFLSGGSNNALEVKFEFSEEDGVPIILTDEEVRYVFSGQINPQTGEVDPDIKSKVSIFFCPTLVMKSLLSIDLSSPKWGA